MSVLSLAEAKAYLNITTGDSDAEIQDTIDEAESMIAQKCGPLASVTISERIPGSPGGLSLRTTPVISLTSVTPLGMIALNISDLNVTPSGVVTYAYAMWSTTGIFYAPWYDVVYQAGRVTLPDDLRRGVKVLLKNLWDDQRPRGGRFASDVGSEASNRLPGAAYLFTFKVDQAIAPHLQGI